MVGVSSFVAGLDAVSIVATERCNARCRACGYWRQPGGRDFDPAHLKRLLASLICNGGRRVVWTGGEPTLHPRLSEMMAIVRVAGLSNTVITNGIIMARELDRFVPFLDTLVLSMDAPDRETYRAIRGVDAFDALVSLAQRAASDHPRVGLVTCLVVQRANIDLLEEFLELATGLGADRVAFLAPDLYGYGDAAGRGHSFGRRDQCDGTLPAELVPAEDQCQALLRRLPAMRRRISGRVRPDCPTLEFLPIFVDYFRAFRDGGRPASNPPCPMPASHTVVTADGLLKPCFFVPEAVTLPPLGDPLRAPRLEDLRRALREDEAMRERSCRICLQTVREYR